MSLIVIALMACIAAAAQNSESPISSAFHALMRSPEGAQILDERRNTDSFHAVEYVFSRLWADSSTCRFVFGPFYWNFALTIFLLRFRVLVAILS